MKKLTYIIGLLMILSACGDKVKSDKDANQINFGFFPSSSNQFSPEIDEIYRKIVHSNDFEGAFRKLKPLIDNAIFNQDYEDLRNYLAIYFLLPDLSLSNARQSEIYLNEAENLLYREGKFESRWNVAYGVFNYHHKTRNAAEALNYAIKLGDLSDGENNLATAVLAAKAMGMALNMQGNHRSAVRQFFNALFIAEKLGDDHLKLKVLYELSHYYKGHLIYTNALIYKKQELELWSPKTLIDSFEFFHSELHYHDLHWLSQPERLFDTSRVFQIVDFAAENNLKHLWYYASSFVISVLMESNRYGDLLNFYNNRGPDELANIEQSHPHIYFSILAFTEDEKGNNEDAEQYFLKAIESVPQGSEFYGRLYRNHLNYGKFLKRNSRLDEAVVHLSRAYENAEKTGIIRFQIEAADQIREVHRMLHQHEMAYEFLDRHNRLKEEMVAQTRDQQLFRLQIDAEQMIIEERQRIVEVEKSRQIQSQYNLIAVFVVTVFVGLLLIVQFQPPIWLVRVLGYISLLLIFEFIVLQIYGYLHYAAKDYPWRLFGAKVGVISILLPLHHLLEKKLVKFLLKRRESTSPLLRFNVGFFRKWFESLNK